MVETAVEANSVRYRQKFFNRLQELALIQKEWQHYASELVKDHRHLSKLARDKEKELNTLLQVSADRGSPIPRSQRSGGISDYDLDIQTVRRTQKIQKVRSLWKSLCDYFRDSQQERDIIQSILQGVADKYKIDASNINVKVPEMLLREFDREIQSRAVSNTYEGGNLNLLSVIQLWNLSLHLYIEKLHEVGMPDLKDVGPRIHSHVHTHNAHLADLRALETKLKNEVIPGLKESIGELQTKLNATHKVKTPPSSRNASLRLGLMPPTPPINFDGSPVDSEAVPSRPLMRTPKSSDESTPEAASRLMSTIRKERHSPLVQGSPLFSARATLTGHKFHSKLPIHVPESSERKPPEGRVRQRSAPSKVTVKTPKKDTITARAHLTSQVQRTKSAVTREKFYSNDLTTSVMTTPTTPDRKELDVFSSLKHPPTPGSTSRERAENVLVDKIVDSIVSFSPLYQASALSNENTPQDVNDINLKDPMAALQETAFQVRDKIARSPFDDRSAIPKINLDASKNSSDSSPTAIARPVEQEALLERFEAADMLSEADEFNVSDSNNNNNYIGKSQEKLDEIFRRSPGIEEDEKHLEELLSFSMKIDDSYNPFPETRDSSSCESKISLRDRKLSPRHQETFDGVDHASDSTKRRVHFSETDIHTESRSLHEPQGDLLDFDLEKADTLHVLGGLKKFSLDDDVLNGFDDIVVGGEVLNSEEQIFELKRNESLLSDLHESDELLDTRSGKDTSEIEVPLIDINIRNLTGFTPSGSMSNQSSSRFPTIHSNMLDESVEDLNDISLGDLAAPDDFELDAGQSSPPQATSPTAIDVPASEESKLSSATGISNDLLMRFQRLKMSNANPTNSLVTKENGVPSLPLPGESEEDQDDKGLDAVYLMQSPRPKLEEDKKFTLDLAFESDSDEGKEAEVENVFYTPDHKTRFKSRLDDMLGDDDSLLVPSSP
ncbi:uncharacterized protein LOC135483298 isoform X2 [Lineus longissimus]